MQSRCRVATRWFFGASALFWINLRSHDDLEVELDNLGGTLDSIRPAQAATVGDLAVFTEAMSSLDGSPCRHSVEFRFNN